MFADQIYKCIYCIILLEEIQRVVMLAGVRTDGPVTLSVLVFSPLISLGAAPALPRVFSTVHPVSTPVVRDTLEDEGEDAALAGRGT